MSNKLTPKQEKFCQEMRKLGNQYQAYCNAFNTRKMSRNAIDVEASKLMNNPKITLRIKELAEELKKESIAEAQEIQEMLTKIIRGQMQEEVLIAGECILKTVTPSTRIKACDLLAKMRGYYEAKITMDVPIIIDDISRDPKEIQRKIEEQRKRNASMQGI